MAARSVPASSRQAPRASFVVVLWFHEVYRGMAGPHPTEQAALQWVDDVIADEPGWTWTVEPLVHPEALPTARERGRVPRPQLRLIGGGGGA